MAPEHPDDDQPPHGDPLGPSSEAPPAPAEKRPTLQPDPDDEELPHGDPLRED